MREDEIKPSLFRGSGSFQSHQQYRGNALCFASFPSKLYLQANKVSKVNRQGKLNIHILCESVLMPFTQRDELSKLVHAGPKKSLE